MKQSKLRKKRVFRYMILYFVMLVVFVALIVAPLVIGNKIPSTLTKPLSDAFLLQPTGLNNDDTRGDTQTGTGYISYSGVYTKSTSSTTATAAEATTTS
jgi:1,3-beta-glucan synthase